MFHRYCKIYQLLSIFWKTIYKTFKNTVLGSILGSFDDKFEFWVNLAIKVAKNFHKYQSRLCRFFTFGQNYRFPSDIGGPVTSIILMLELSYYMQNSWAVDALFIGTIPRVPCTAVFLRSHVQNILCFSRFFRDDIWIGSHFYNIDPRIKCL